MRVKAQSLWIYSEWSEHTPFGKQTAEVSVLNVSVRGQTHTPQRQVLHLPMNECVVGLNLVKAEKTRAAVAGNSGRSKPSETP